MLHCVACGLAGEEVEPPANKKHGFAYWVSAGAAALVAGGLLFGSAMAHGQTQTEMERFQRNPGDYQALVIGTPGNDFAALGLSVGAPFDTLVSCQQWVGDYRNFQEKNANIHDPKLTPDAYQIAVLEWDKDARWLQGFMSGVNYAYAGKGASAYVGSTKNEAQLTDAVTAYCQEHPGARAIEAAIWVRHELQTGGSK